MTENSDMGLRQHRGKPLPPALEERLERGWDAVTSGEQFGVMNYLSYVTEVLALYRKGYNVSEHLEKTEELNLLYGRMLFGTPDGNA